MNIVLLYSDLDNFIVICIAGTTALMFLLNWFKDNLKSRTSSTDSIQDDNFKQRLDNYTLNFESHEFAVKPFGAKAKITSLLISLIIVVIPLHEFIEILRPKELFLGWTCLPY
ncbi:hypothetical protein [uncultured Winogradskyella sp.]|uniref:hypothetical protein n=1 Tax=uncultured Winogradskyella sp. TaxID=395353 RepID=UPI00262E2F63|nr:hypothetical protein [uncultured Winogradskyella sp.]